MTRTSQKEIWAISLPQTGLHDFEPSGTSRLHISRVAAVVLGAALMIWPALLNGYPLLYPDSMTYLGDGRLVARAVFLHKLSDYYGMRSFIYSLGILPWHWNVTPWPVVALQALLTAYVIWLVVRSIVSRRAVWWYLVVCGLLSLLTSLSWFVSLIMPDILGPVLYLCIYLLVFARETLSRLERLAVMLIAWWGVASHATHLMLAVGMCVLLASLIVLRRKSRHRLLRGVAEVAMVILLAAATQLALHAYLYGEPSLNGERPPFVMARIISDGPGRWYLEKHCGELNFAICGFVHNLPDNADDFLWAPNGVWSSASEDTRKRLLQEELPFALATLRAYPRAQIFRSANNFWEELTSIDFAVDANGWILEEFDSVLPGRRALYLRSRQARDALPADFFISIQNWTVMVSLAVIGLFAPHLWRRRPARLVGLGVIIVFAVIANAFVTGVLSTVEDRYEGRVIWLLPFLACALLLYWGERRQCAEA